MKTITAAIVVFALLQLLFIERLDAQGLTQLYNSKVVSAQRYLRPLDFKAPAWIKKILPKHCGVVVTLANGQRWLVQKGDGYGKASQTVVVSTSQMSSVWSAKESKRIQSSTVGDYVRVGGKNYDTLTDNCIHACNRMMRLN